jgi:DNA-binding transcriptional ArsR family regulator
MRQALRDYKARVFQALSHPTRVGIVEQLRYGEMSVAQLCEQLAIEQANASQHLAVLRNSRIVASRRDGNQVFYRLSHDTMGKLLDLLREFFSAHLDEALDVIRSARDEDRTEPDGT